MQVDVSERAFEDAIEACLLQNGKGLVREERGSYLDPTPGGYRKRTSEDYDRALCLIPEGALDFVLVTQPKEWQRYCQHHGQLAKEQFLKRLASEIGRRGALDVLRHGVRDMGCRFQLVYYRPSSGLNEQTRELYRGNIFSVVRQLHYSERNNKSLDLALFLNGIPIFTAELKNPLTGQTVQDAIRQYRTDRDPREPLFAYRRCLAHFAVDPDLVYVTTRLAGPKPTFCLSTAASSAAPATRPFRQRKAATPPPTCGRRPGRETACWTWRANSSTRLRKKTTGARRRASAT